MRSSGESIPVWQAEETYPSYSALSEGAHANICVVGAGIAGLTTAYQLQKQGHSVIVLDAWTLGAGESGRTTAHLTAVLDDRYFSLESLFGQDNARLAAASHGAAVAHIERAATSGKTLTQEDVRKMAARIRSQISRSQVPLPSSIEEILQDERPKRTV
jgi:glycine/D-amino acid oxidase-like deaminating enzyme